MTAVFHKINALTFSDITLDSIDVGVLSDFVQTPATGAAVEFLGRVRNHDHGRTVTALEYEAHPTASHVLDQIVKEISGRFGEVRIGAVHRIGRLAIGETAMAVTVGAAHRADAFNACIALVEEIKASLPIWKLQTFEDGTTEWVNCL